MSAPPDILILCGGRATRLGGIEKSLAALAGQPLIARVLARLPADARVLISANTQRDDYLRHGSSVLDDAAYAQRGPLAGIHAGLAACATEDLLCVPGDAPLLPTDLLERLRARRAAAGVPIGYAHDGRGPQPLCCLIRRSALGGLRAYLDAGGNTPREWFARAGAVAVPFGETPAWGWSLNTPEEWRAAELALGAATLPP